MVQRSKWVSADGLNAGEFPADALRDLKTEENALSFWVVDTANNDEWWKEPALALASRRERLDNIEVVSVEASDIAVAMVRVQTCTGETPVQDIAERHVNFESLDLKRLFEVASMVGRAFDMHWKKLTRKEVKELIKRAIAERRVAPEALKVKLREDVTK